MSVSKSKKLPGELLDENRLYVHLSEITDAPFKVSEEDKSLSRRFYRGQA